MNVLMEVIIVMLMLNVVTQKEVTHAHVALVFLVMAVIVPVRKY